MVCLNDERRELRALARGGQTVGHERASMHQGASKVFLCWAEDGRTFVAGNDVAFA